MKTNLLIFQVFAVLLFLRGTQAVTEAIAILSPFLNDTTITGTVTFQQTLNGTYVTVNITGIITNPNSEHGIHVHEYGDLRDGGGLASVGSHYNPSNAPHGCPFNTTHHEGDMGNWQATGGSISQTKLIPWMVLDGSTRSIVGRAVVLHSTVDNCVTTGSAGNRLAAGVIGIMSITGNGALPSTGFGQAVCVLQGTTYCQGTQCGISQAGLVLFQNQASGGVSVLAQVNGITTERGFHIHTYGDLSDPQGISAGSHFNPDNFNHNLPAVLSRHVGDLGSINTFSGGSGFYSYTPEYSPATSWTVDKILGRSVVVHASLDHGNDSTCGAEAETTGASGSRVYICVVGILNNVTTGLTTPQIPNAVVPNNTWTNVPCAVVPSPSSAPSSAPSSPPSTPSLPPSTPPSTSPSPPTASPSGGHRVVPYLIVGSQLLVAMALVIALSF